MQIYTFDDILKTVLWGGNKLTAFKGLPACDAPIGESWELSGVPGRESVVADGPDRGLTLTQLVQHHGAALVGEEVYRQYGDQFPLLIKLIDATRDLSIQVHPDDAMACRLYGCRGKNEMWYVLQADEEALIRTGFNRPMSPEEFDRRQGDGSLLEVITTTASKPGDVFFIPAGQIHSIGAGNLLVEIQQTSDLTYRVWDYGRRDADGRLRELHLQEAREALNYDVIDSVVDCSPAAVGGVTSVVSCPQFDVRLVDVDGRLDWPLPDPHSFVALVCIDGATSVEADGMAPVAVRQGDTVLVPAVATAISFVGTARLLAATVECSKFSETSED